MTAPGELVLVDLQGQWRLDDQPALARAMEKVSCRKGTRLVLTSNLNQTSPLLGPHQRRLALQAKRALLSRLPALGIGWLEPEAADRPEDLPEGIEIERCEPNRLFAKPPIALGAFPRVFADFRRQVTAHGPCEPFGPGEENNPAANGELVGGSSFPFGGDEFSALQRLHHFVHGSMGLKNYKQTRNELSGVEFSSKFSAWLSLGAISVRRIWAELLRYQATHGVDEGSQAMQQELLWREFFIWLELANPESFYSIGGIQARNYEYLEDQQKFAKWCQADSGHPLIDAALTELNSTGYLSNRVRQWVASDFIHRIRLPWLWGARWFAWQLIDSTPSQNIGNWSYLAGVGADPRSFGSAGPRYFDLEKQLHRYDPEGNYIKRWS